VVGEEEGDGDGDLDPHEKRGFGEADADQDEAGADHAGLGRRVHAHEEVGQAQHADRRDEADRGARDEEEGGEKGPSWLGRKVKGRMRGGSTSPAPHRYLRRCSA
jgi:hypothetical protein